MSNKSLPDIEKLKQTLFSERDMITADREPVFEKIGRDEVDEHNADLVRTINESENHIIRVLAEGASDQTSEAIEQHMDLLLGRAEFLHSSPNPRAIGGDTLRDVQKHTRKRPVFYEKIPIAELSIADLSIADLFHKELEIEQILIFLRSATKAVTRSNGSLEATYTNLFGELFGHSLALDFRGIEQFPERAKYWVANSRLFYAYLADLLERGEILDPDIVGYIDSSHLGYLFSHLAVTEIRKGKSIEDFMRFLAKVEGQKHINAMQGVISGFLKTEGREYDPVGENSQKNDPLYDQEPVDLDTLEYAYQVITEELEANSEEISRALKQRKKGVEFDVKGLLFAERMGIVSLIALWDEEKDTDLLFATTFRNGFKTVTMMNLDSDVIPIEVQDQIEPVDPKVMHEFEILLMSLLLDFTKQSDNKKSKKRLKLKANEMMLRLSRESGLDLGRFDLVGEYDTIDPETAEVKKGFASVWRDYRYCKKHWSEPRVITTINGDRRRMMYPHQGGIGILPHPDLPITRKYARPDLDLDPFARLLFEELSERSKLLAIETVLLNQV